MNTPAGGVTLPELPEPGIDGYMGEPAYTADQMREYARAALAGEWRVPEGWRLVPTSADAAILRAMLGWRECDSREGLTGELDMFERAYHCALSAAPLPKEPGR